MFIGDLWLAIGAIFAPLPNVRLLCVAMLLLLPQPPPILPGDGFLLLVFINEEVAIWRLLCAEGTVSRALLEQLMSDCDWALRMDGRVRGRWPTVADDGALSNAAAALCC